MTAKPCFSVVIGAYNRAGIIRRCVESCLQQSFAALQVVVVDDGSTDGTAEAAESLGDSRVVVLRHRENRGICPARHSGVSVAKGEWIVTIDSDWELLPGALQRLHEVTSALSVEIGGVGARIRWDTGRVTPGFVPRLPIDYEGRIRWVEAEGGTDHLFCARRSTYEVVNWPADRRGGFEALYQFDFCSRWKQVFVDDILAFEHSDAPNSHTRATGSDAVATLLRNARDLASQGEEMLARHGAALRRWAPTWYIFCERMTGLNHFLAGHRRRGSELILHYLAKRPLDPTGWGILVAGLLGSSAAARANLWKRRAAQRSRARPSRRVAEGRAA